jgi:acyl carrier protein
MLTEENVRNALKPYLHQSLNGVISLDDELLSKGIDSLDFFNVLLELCEIVKIEIPDEDIDQLKTIRTILDYFNSRAS